MNGWINFRYLELNGRKKKEITFPKRERMLVRGVLDKLQMKYKEMQPFQNPLYNGWKEEGNGSIMWADFTVWSKKHNKMFLIQFDPRDGKRGLHSYRRKAFQELQNHINNKNIPLLILSRLDSSQIYEMKIVMFLRKWK